jgi:hypothetical protein
MERTLEKEKSTWRKTEEQRLKSKVETELAVAKMDWIKVGTSIRSYLFISLYDYSVIPSPRINRNIARKR